MGAHSKDGDGSIVANEKPAKSLFLVRIKCQKANKQNEEAPREAAREVTPSDRSSGRDSDRHISSGDFANQHTESQNIVHDIEDPESSKNMDRDDNIAEDPESSKNMDRDDNIAEEPSKNMDRDDNIAEEPPSCVECGKIFPSLKALYGHLRCHPLRGYRGAHRPPEPKNNLQKDAGSSSDKVPTSKKDNEGNLESDGAVVNASRILMQMSRSNKPWHPLSLRRETDQLEHGKGKSISDASIKEMDEENTESKGLQLMDAMQSENVDIEGKCIDAGASRGEEKVKKKKKKIKYLASVHEASPPTQGSGYCCNVCRKSFPTHQALGGHRASHNKNKNNSEEVDEAGGGNLGLADPNNLVPRAAATTEHRCTLCQATFPTGQALGGHKRKHWNPPSSPPAPSLAPLSESVQKLYLDIDLNELPNLEADEP